MEWFLYDNSFRLERIKRNYYDFHLTTNFELVAAKAETRLVKSSL